MKLLRVHGLVVDASTPITRTHARRLKEAGVLAVVRCYDFRTATWAEPTQDEVSGILAEGLGLGLYPLWRADGHSAETGRMDAARQIARRKDLGVDASTPEWADLEAHVIPSAENARGYADAMARVRRTYGLVPRAYYASTFSRSGAVLSGIFDEWWESGAAPRAPDWLPPAYVMRQKPNRPGSSGTQVAGMLVDINEAFGAPFMFADHVVADGVHLVEDGQQPRKDTNVTDPLAFRAVDPNETKAQRVVRIACHLADMGKGSRDLLEPGARTVPWTCMMTLRAILYHASLKPEDGWPTITVAGETFGGDYGPKIGSGFDDRIMNRWGRKFGGIGGLRGRWPIEPGTIFCTGSHVGLVCHVDELADGGLRVFTVEGGQVDGRIPKGTHSWVTTPNGPREVTIDDEPVDDHARRFAHTWYRTPLGAIGGLLSVAEMGDWAIGPRVAPKAETADVPTEPTVPAAPDVHDRDTLPEPDDGQSPVVSPPMVASKPAAWAVMAALGAAVLAGLAALLRGCWP